MKILNPTLLITSGVHKAINHILDTALECDVCVCVCVCAVGEEVYLMSDMNY
jgi:hypothetical protein